MDCGWNEWGMRILSNARVGWNGYGVAVSLGVWLGWFYRLLVGLSSVCVWGRMFKTGAFLIGSRWNLYNYLNMWRRDKRAFGKKLVMILWVEGARGYVFHQPRKNGNGRIIMYWCGKCKCNSKSSFSFRKTVFKLFNFSDVCLMETLCFLNFEVRKEKLKNFASTRSHSCFSHLWWLLSVANIIWWDYFVNSRW